MLREIIENYIKNYKCFQNKMILEEIEELNKILANCFREPRIGILGLSDAGKSTFINSLIGKGIIPADYTPMTSIVLYVKHISRRPDFMKKEVYIFKNDENGEWWNDLRLQEEEYCQKLTLAEGDYNILQRYGTRDGEEDTEATSGVLFINSDILKDCDIVDFPGYGTGDREQDTILTINGTYLADVIIYMSLCIGFLKGEEINYLTNALNILKPIEKKGKNSFRPYENLYILASQAHLIKNSENSSVEKLNRILDKGADRLFNSISEDFWKRKEANLDYVYDKSIIRSRFYYYAMDREELQIPVLSSISNFIPRLNIAFKKEANENLVSYKSARASEISNEIQKLIDVLENNIKIKNYYERKKIEAPIIKEKIEEKSLDMLSYMDILASKSENTFSAKFKEIINIENIVNLLKLRGIKNKKESIEEFNSYIASKLNNLLLEILIEDSTSFNERIDEYLEDIDKAMNFEEINIDFRFSNFDIKSIFISGFSSLGTYGALTLWLGSLGNLGGYIAVTKAVSILSAIGISISGGTAAAVSAVAAIGGPFTIVVGLSILMGGLVKLLISINWRKDISKKMVDGYKDGYRNYLDMIKKHWSDTEIGFFSSKIALLNSVDEELVDLKKKLEDYDEDRVRLELKIQEELFDFVKHIPESE